MVRTSLPAVVVASAAVMLATSVTPAGRAAVVSPASVVTAPVPGGAGSGEVAAAHTSSLTSRRAGNAVREGLTERVSPAGPAGATAGPARGAGVALNRGATRPPSSAGAAGVRWRWPVRPRPAVARPFRAPLTTYGAGHRGLDLAVDDGTAVRAVEDGVVTHAGLVAGRGTVTVAHRGGLSSTYEPVDPVVATGAVVVAGQVIGALRVRAAPAHCGARTCLHLGARRGAAYLDPYPLLAGGRVALLPLGE